MVNVRVYAQSTLLDPNTPLSEFCVSATEVKEGRCSKWRGHRPGGMGMEVSSVDMPATMSSIRAAMTRYKPRTLCQCGEACIRTLHESKAR